MAEPSIMISVNGIPFTSKLQKINQTPHFFCFMDLLGSKENIVKNKDDVFISSLYAILDICNQFQASKALNIKIKTFSDNICLVMPVPPQEQKAKSYFKDFLAISAIFQILLILATGELVRGGLTVGDVFCDEYLVWGKALVSAHELEEKQSVYPRIGIDKIACQQYFSDSAMQFIARTENNFLFLNFFGILDHDNASFLVPAIHNKLLEKIKRTFVPGDVIKGKVFDKIGWVCRFYNRVAKNIGREDLMIEGTWTVGGTEISLIADDEYPTPTDKNI